MLTLSEHRYCSCYSILSLLCNVLLNIVCLFIQFIWPMVSKASHFPFWYFQAFMFSYISSIHSLYCVFACLASSCVPYVAGFFLNCPFFWYSLNFIYLCYFHYSKLSCGFLKIRRALIVIKFTRIARHCLWTINVARTYVFCLVKWMTLLGFFYFIISKNAPSIAETERELIYNEIFSVCTINAPLKMKFETMPIWE